MTHVYFDASAISKRYVRERGTPEVNHVFGRTPGDRVHVLAVGAGEVVSVLVRRRNGGLLPPAAYSAALARFRTEILDDPTVEKVAADAATVRASLDLIDRHSINATDALILRTALDLQAVLAPAGDDLVVVACDQRLVAAARAEGLPAFDPERQRAADFDAAFTA